jgi:hypothetical protein
MRWLTDGAARLVAPWTDAFRAYPVISGATVALVTVGDSGRLPRGIAREEALIEVAGTLMRNFRQDRPKAQARTRWPEPNSLRRFFGTWDPRHNPGDGPSFYPRAALGLPIVFHFRGGKTVARHGQQNFEPNAELVGAEHDRLASPLILRPQVLKDEAVILALVLDTPWEPPGGLALKSAGGRERLPLAAGPVEGGERDGRHVLPLRERGAEDALTAFVRMLHADYGARIVTLEGRDGE